MDGTGIEGEGRVLRLEDLKKFPKHTVTAAIQCGGNRRYRIKLRLTGWPIWLWNTVC